MNSRERIRTALAHQEPDRIPFDLGSFGATGIHWKAYVRLRKYLGLPERPVRIWDTMQQLAYCEEDLLIRLQADARLLERNPPSNWKLHIFEENGGQSYVDEWGIKYHMPSHGLYYDPRGHPLQDVETVEEVERYPWADPTDPARFAGLAEKAKNIQETTGAAVTLGSCFVGFFEGINWLRGLEQSMIDLILNPKLVQAIMEKIAEMKIAYWSTVLPILDGYVDIVSESDDLGGQNGPLISVEMYRKYIKPLHTRIFSTMKKYTDAPVWFHSCGSIWDFLPDFIESGVEVLNPVQTSAAKMDTEALKREFGQDLSFWGGGCDTQKILPRGTPQQVREEVKRRIDDLAPGGGFVFNPVHNIQADVPPENIMTMWETWQEHAAYK
ncbi:MAG: uroporphyrinogen decarboxylase family protein [Anaerolineales bacterium]|jgi:uroporphyrinogen decarboxylase